MEARYSGDKREILKRANLRLEKIQVLLRLCHEQQFLSHDAFEFAVQGVDETGGSGDTPLIYPDSGIR